MTTTRARVTFSSFDATAEVSGIDGSTFVVVNVPFRIDYGAGCVADTAAVGISDRAGRRTFELYEPAWAAESPLAQAIVEYVRGAERRLRLHLGQPRDALLPDAHIVELDLDLDLGFDLSAAAGP